MSEKDKRQKASDVFRDAHFVFAEKTTFEKAFPEIEDITVVVRETGHGVSEWNKERAFGKRSIEEYVDCSNSLCYNGGFSLGEIIRRMVRDKLTELETTKICQGNEGSPKGRRIYRKCMNGFHVKVKIKYRDANQEE